MANCKIYVKSRGFSQNHDYRWVDEKNQLVEEPPSVTKIQDLIESESFSVAIARGKDERGQEYLLLLITGIKSREREKERKDFRNRTILTSVAWICENSKESEQHLRAIASNVLDIKSKVKDKIYGYIENTDSSDCGFEVNFDALTLSKLAPEKIGNKEPELNQKLSKNLQDERQKLSDELKESRLPKSEDLNKKGLMSEHTALIVVTGIKSESAFKEAHIWRGLSNLVGEGDNTVEKLSRTREFPESWSYKKAIIVIILCASLIMNALQFYVFTQKNQEIENFKHQLESLPNQKQIFDEKIKDLVGQNQESRKKIQDLLHQNEEFGEQLQKLL